MGLVDKLQELLDEHQLTQKEAAQRLNISPNTLNAMFGAIVSRI